MNLIEMSILAAIVLVGLFAVGLIFSRLYRRSSKELSFVRTGLGGQKVVMGGVPQFRSGGADLIALTDGGGAR